jgi:hypothetical protein
MKGLYLSSIAGWVKRKIQERKISRAQALLELQFL